MEDPWAAAQANGITTSNSFGFNYRDQWSKTHQCNGKLFVQPPAIPASFPIHVSQNFYETNSFVNKPGCEITSPKGIRIVYVQSEYQVDSVQLPEDQPQHNYGGNDGNKPYGIDYSKPPTIPTAKQATEANKNLSNSQAPNPRRQYPVYNHKFRKRAGIFSQHQHGNVWKQSEQDVTNLTIQYVLPFIGPQIPSSTSTRE